MTKGELNNKAWELFWGRIDPAKFAAYVDEFEQALLQQTEATLRAALVAKLSEAQKMTYGMDEITAARYDAEESTLQWGIELIDEIFRIEAKTP